MAHYCRLEHKLKKPIELYWIIRKRSMAEMTTIQVTPERIPGLPEKLAAATKALKNLFLDWVLKTPSYALFVSPLRRTPTNFVNR